MSSCLLPYILGGLVLASPAVAVKARAAGSPLGKIVELLTKLQGDLVANSEKEVAAYKKFQESCNDRSLDLQEQIKVNQQYKDETSAQFQQAVSNIDISTSKMQDGIADISNTEAKLKKHTEIRAKEADSAGKTEKELMQASDMLQKAIIILKKETEGNGAAFLQSSAATGQLQNVVMGLSAVIEGASLGSSEDLSKLTALLQTRQDAEDGSDGQQSPEAYKAKSGGIVDVLEDLREKASTQLRESRHAEQTAIENFKLIKQGLDQSAADFEKDKKDAGDDKTAAEKGKARAKGQNDEYTKSLSQATETLAATQSDCMRTATDHEASVHGREAELKTLAEAKKMVQASMGGAALAQTAAQPAGDAEVFSFVQVSNRQRGHQQIAGVVGLVQKLARQQNSDSLKQLASRIAAVIRYGSNGSREDPFKKVNGLLKDMIQKLEREQNGDMSEKKYCDTEMKKTLENQESLQDASTSLKTKIDQAGSASSKLKGEAKELQWSLARKAEERKKQDEARNEQHGVFVEGKGELESSLNAIRSAIHVLRDFYSAEKEDDDAAASFIQTDAEDSDSENESDGDADAGKQQQPSPPEKFEKAQSKGEGIIGMLSVVESDFAKNLASMQSEEDEQQGMYEKEVQEEKVWKAETDAGVRYKNKESTGLDKAVSELQSDYSTTNDELNAVDKYFAEVKERCVAKPDKYEDRSARRNKEIQGLMEAKEILMSEDTSSGGQFLQRHRA